VARLARRHQLESVLLLSDDTEVGLDLAVLLPHMRITTIELPAMEAVTNTSVRHRTTSSPAAKAHAARAQVGPTPLDLPSKGDAPSTILKKLEIMPRCGLPATGGHPPLPSCRPAGGQAPGAGPAAAAAVSSPRVIRLDPTHLLSGPHLATGPRDLAGILTIALWALSNARVIMASSTSNMGVLLYTMAGASRVSSALPTSTPLLAAPSSPPLKSANGYPIPELVDIETKAGAHFDSGMLEQGKYFCRLDWGPRRFGLCTAGQQFGHRPAKTW
jgi:hypothetical protein